MKKDFGRELTEVYTIVKRMDKQLFGNGQPGMLKNIETEMDGIRSKLGMHDTKIKMLDNFDKTIKWSIGTFITLILTNIGLIIKIV